MSKCINCNKNEAKIKFQVFTWSGIGKSNVNFECCSEECKKEVEEFCEYVNKNVMKFFILIFLGSFSFIPFIILYNIYKNELFGALGLTATLGLIGVAIILFPFSTPETNSKLGLRKAKKVTRIIGYVLLVISIIPVIFYLIGL
ncbi:MAG: hypothetical protein Q8942_15500 [Bacillota bacterium]|nr:hypothetical protein [Bacillota bacterium]